MDGLSIIVSGVFVGVPAGLALVVWLVTLAIALRSGPPSRRQLASARAARFGAPVLALVYPLSIFVTADSPLPYPLFFSCVLDLPVLAVAIVTFVLASRVLRRAA